MLKFSLGIVFLVTNFLFVQAQNQNDYSESASPPVRKFETGKKSNKVKKEEILPLGDAGNVSIPVTVVDINGNFVNNLKVGDFKVFVDDVEVKPISFQTTENQSLNVIFILDISPSADAQFIEMKKFAGRMIENLNARDKILFVTFDEKSKALNALTGDRSIISKTLDKLKTLNGGTALYDTVANVFKKYLPADNEKYVVVMLTDGVDTVSKKYDYEKSLDIVRKHNVPVTTFYLDTLADALDPKRPLRISGSGFPTSAMMTPIYGKVNEEQLKNEYAIGRNYLSDLAITSGGATFLVKDYSALTAEQYRSLAPLIKPQYYLNFVADAAKAQGNIKIRINRPQLKINARSRF